MGVFILGEPLLMDIRSNVYLEDDTLVLIDRRRLPEEIRPHCCHDCEEVARAIEDMVVQGAGDIAITAGYGLYLAARQGRALDPAAARLKATRPTGWHLAAFLDKTRQRVASSEEPPAEVILAAVNQAIERQNQRSFLTGRWGATRLSDGDTILTHCFAGPGLLQMLRLARDEGKRVGVVATETRPYLQGARLTAWSVSQLDLDVTLITDNMAAYVMFKGMVNKVFTAADRVAMDGWAANKVGTYQLAIAAAYHRLPFYVLGYGGPDPQTPAGRDIPIEERDPLEVLTFRGQRITGPAVKGYYPAFDLTPPELVAEIITDRGVFAPARIGEYFSSQRKN